MLDPNVREELRAAIDELDAEACWAIMYRHRAALLAAADEAARMREALEDIAKPDPDPCCTSSTGTLRAIARAALAPPAREGGTP